jgi:hypothetical protein
MPSLERAVVELVADVLKARRGETPAWLIRPGRAEAGGSWRLIKGIYRELTHLDLPEVMRPVERRQVDAVLMVPGRAPRILEFDEKQHFNTYRAATLKRYADRVALAFNQDTWIERSQAKRRLEGGGFAAPKPPLFPGEGGRHRQRAFRDALSDVLPLEYEWAPTLRIGHFEVEKWIHVPDARKRMKALLEARLV